MANSHLIPVDSFKSGFTTCAYLQADYSSLLLVPLGDKPLGVHKNTSRTPHPLVEPPKPTGSTSSPNTPAHIPSPETAWQAEYKKGSINPSSSIPGGFGFYLSGPPGFSKELDAGANDVVLSYRMMLRDDWEWAKGGKLPGAFGGEGSLSYSCSGGRQTDRCKCFNLRLMWRSAGAGELYAYIPLTTENERRLLRVPPSSKKNADYGFSVGQCAFRLDIAKGKWISIASRIKLNDVGLANGFIQLWIDGASVISIEGLQLRETAEGKIKGLHFSTFFGGHTEEWASPKDQYAWFADVTGVILS